MTDNMVVRAALLLALVCASCTSAPPRSGSEFWRLTGSDYAKATATLSIRCDGRRTRNLTLHFAPTDKYPEDDYGGVVYASTMTHYLDGRVELLEIKPRTLSNQVLRCAIYYSGLPEQEFELTLGRDDRIALTNIAIRSRWKTGR